MRARTQFRLGPFMLSGWLWLVVIPLVLALCCCGVFAVGSSIEPPEPTAPEPTGVATLTTATP